MNDLELRGLYQRIVSLRTRADRNGCCTPEEIVALSDTSLAPEDRVRLLTHVATCAHCQRDLALARAVAQTRTAGTWMRSYPAIGVAAAVVIMVFGGIMVTRTNAGREEIMRGEGTRLELIRPTAGELRAPGERAFVWHAIPGARRYQVEVLTDAGAVAYEAAVADTSISLPGRITLSRDTDFLWRVTATLGDGTMRASVARRFRIR